jgi:hypothetical protein
MQVDIDITSEQLVKTALGRYKTQHDSPDLLLANTIADMHSNTDAATVIRQAVTNSIAAGIKRMERQAMAAEAEFEAIGQMSLLGELVPEHKIPAGMTAKSVAEVAAWTDARAEIEQENLEEMRAAFKRQEAKAARFAKWAEATKKVQAIVERAGLDPREVTYAEAISKAEALSEGRRADVGAQAGKPLR